MADIYRDTEGDDVKRYPRMMIIWLVISFSALGIAIFDTEGDDVKRYPRMMIIWLVISFGALGIAIFALLAEPFTRTFESPIITVGVPLIRDTAGIGMITSWICALYHLGVLALWWAGAIKPHTRI